jgi:hypothetical protein
VAELTFGARPHSLAVILERDTDFNQDVLTGDGSDWPADLALQLRFSDDDATVWTATLDGPTATFSQDKAVVNALLDAIGGAASRRVRLFADDNLWAKGNVTSP